MRLGTEPLMASSRSASTYFGFEGSEFRRPTVYGWAGDFSTGPTAPSSTLRPAYITTTRSAFSATTPMSCVMRRIATRIRRCRSFSSSRICAWMVTSSAVVGSSAMSSPGSGEARAMAIITRWRMPPESWCG